MISLENIHKTFNPGTVLENHVLRGLSLKLEPGEFVTVIGSNGAGKSTLLNCIAGEIFPDQGKIIVDNRDISHLPAHRRAALVARVFQNPLAGTCANLTIAENLALALQRGRSRSLRGALNAANLAQFREVLAALQLNLENRLDDRIGLLSGGQRQAVSLLMASLTPSAVLLLDEHTAALDPKTAHFVLELTGKIVAQQRLTTLMITHSMRQALDFGDRTIMLHQGQVAFDLSGEARAKAEVADLLALFERQKGESINDDSLLLD